MKKIKRIYQQICSFENLLEAARKARKGKRRRASTMRFQFSLEGNLLQIQRELQDKSYEPGPYRDFYVQEMKRRLISAAPYRDRVIHHAIMNVLEPRFEQRFIHDTYACRENKGTHAALERFRSFSRRAKYALKCDIRKYFQSIDHEILLDILCRKIGDKDCLWLLETIVRSKHFNRHNPIVYFDGDDLFSPTMRDRGIPVGNLTSQFFANLYLDGMDHFIKESLHVKFYLRYVDDFCLFGDDKSLLNACKERIREYLSGVRLRLSERKSRIYTLKEGVEFLGFRHFPDKVRLRKENTVRFKKRMKRLERQYSEGEVTLDRIRASVQSWVAHASYADSVRLRADTLPGYKFHMGG